MPLGRTAKQQQAGLNALTSPAANDATTPPIPVIVRSAQVMDRPRIMDQPTVAAPPARRTAARHSRRPSALARVKAAPWPLLIILAIQTALSLRLVWSNTAFVDEATYLYAGNQEIHYLLAHGTLTVPGQNGYYQTYFSGAPVLYPVLGAIANSIGGLAGARLLSLAFVLSATTLLYWTTARLYDRRAATGAISVFAILGPTQFLGAFATYDAMALCLMALAAFLTAKSTQEDDNTLTLPFASLVMVFADATKYAVILFDPVIIAIAIFASVPRRTWPEARRQGYRMLGYSATIGGVLLAAGGHTYLTGIMSTTLARASGNTPATLVLSDSWYWVGAVAVIAALAIIVHVVREPSGRTWMCVLLAGAVLLAPFEQARMHTTTSLQKHDDFGAWFASIVAGYAIAKIMPAARRRAQIVILASVAAAAIAATAAVMTIPQATALYQAWNNSTREVAALKPWAQNVNVLAEDYFIYSYYLGNEVKLQRWANTWNLGYVNPQSRRMLTGVQAYRAAIAHHYFGTVVLTYSDTGAMDLQIVAAMRAAGGYQRVEHIRYRNTWFDVFHDVRSRSKVRT